MLILGILHRSLASLEFVQTEITPCAKGDARSDRTHEGSLEKVSFGITFSMARVVLLQHEIETFRMTYIEGQADRVECKLGTCFDS